MITVAKLAAQSAGQILTKNFGKIQKIKHKDNNIKQLVTSSDLASEKEIIKIIKGKFPESNFLAEESGKINQNSDYTWIIDPLDGTSNYVQGISHFSISIALNYKNETILAVVLDPVRNELFWAQKNKGAFLNNQKIYVSCVKEMKLAFSNVGWTSHGEKEGFEDFVKIAKLTRKIRVFGSAALDLCYLASARYDLIVSHKLNFWDVAAGCLIAREAGAKITDNHDNNISFDKPFEKIIASNKHLHTKLLKQVK